MTFNWGHKLTIGFLAFTTMMVWLVVQSMHTHYDLVSKEYYKEELQYQQVIDGTSRANQLSSKPVISQSAATLTIQLPAEMQQQNITGSILFYSATDAQKDQQFPLQVNTQGVQQISTRTFIPGNYTAKMKWESQGTTYYAEVPVTIQQTIGIH